MNVRQARVKMEELVLTASIRIVVIVILAMKETIVKLILTNARQVHVKTVEHALMELIRTLVIAFLATQETIAKQVVFANLYFSVFVSSVEEQLNSKCCEFKKLICYFQRHNSSSRHR